MQNKAKRPLTRYRIVRFEDDVIVQDMDTHESINDADVLEDLIKALIRNKSYVSSYGKGQNDYKSYLGFIYADQFISEYGKWNWDVHDGYTFPSDTPLSSKSVVYFIEHHNYPGLIKIGHTTDLYKRTQKISEENSNIPPTIIAFCWIGAHPQLERALHWAFNSYRRTGEWFDFKPVMWYLNHWYEFEQSINTVDTDETEEQEQHVWF